jgi:hypothetical protein
LLRAAAEAAATLSVVVQLTAVAAAVLGVI